ncbi:hypothetical protein [Glutamicibacter halophytocola]|uniref:hypothetical protein n=1 Tax=Glutamicibacter halophytocola TaxID=1933880 RepID=UPI001644EE91|nr:hypothetical protein [Glutamicibacter halophytocola]
MRQLPDPIPKTHLALMCRWDNFPMLALQARNRNTQRCLIHTVNKQAGSQF